ncbi:MAG: hypothetical protein DMG50_28105 [Acidobacteria bacterium]|nr:MAG: hypothetical protein DMG50_28105 [Acidobacteriota bacterium]
MNHAFVSSRYLAPHNSDSDPNACLDEFGGSGVFGHSLDGTQPGAPWLRWRQHGRASLGGACAPPLLSPYRRRPRRATGGENCWKLALCSGGICRPYFGPHVLRAHRAPSQPVGIVLLILAAAVMPWLARQKRQLSAATGSAALRADAAESLVCGYLALIALAGLVANALWKLSWADPVAALLLLPLITREGWEAVRGKPCCATD